MRRRTLTGLAALTLFDIAAAHAQPPPPPDPSWAGLYVGAHAGYRFADIGAFLPSGGFPVFDPNTGLPTFPVLMTSQTFHPGSGIFGLQGGYNFLFGLTFVGIEGDFSWGKGSSSNTFTITDSNTGAFGTNSFAAAVDWSASLRGRLGYATGPWLFYGTVGVSFLRTTVSGAGAFAGGGCLDVFDGLCFATSSSSAFSFTKTLTGLVIGAGVEHLFANRFMIRVEYLFADYGHVDFGNVAINSSFSDGGIFCNCNVNSAAIGNVSAYVTTQTVRIGLSTKIP